MGMNKLTVQKVKAWIPKKHEAKILEVFDYGDAIEVALKDRFAHESYAEQSWIYDKHDYYEGNVGLLDIKMNFKNWINSVVDVSEVMK